MEWTEDQMQEALALCDRELIPNYSEIARIFPFDRTTLMRRHQARTTSRQEAIYLYHSALSKHQEEALIVQINKQSARGRPPTTQIVKNLAKEIIGRELNKN